VELIKDSAEHYFLTCLDELKDNSNRWFGLFFSMSKTLSHQDLVSDLPMIFDKIETARAKRDVFAEELQAALQDGFDGSICVFTDMDIFVIAHVKDSLAQKALEDVFKKMAARLPAGMSDMDVLGRQMRSYQKLADEKILSVRKFSAYEAMADKHKVSSISARRKRREDPVVMMVEDDRFTAHYASTILSSDFELVMCKDGEAAVKDYIEHAPDIVFLDIHLPGLSGHDVLQSIQAVDSNAFVVMLSVDSVRENIVNASRMGARKFLKKPFTKERLIETVKNSPYVRELMRGDRAGTDQMFH